MGMTYITAGVMNASNLKQQLQMDFIVDSGALYSVVPRAILKRLRIKARGSKSFILADGTKIVRKYGHAIFSFQGTEAASPVMFGEEGDTPLLGIVSLEALGYILDPLRRELRPLPMMLG